jgi:hypothetical protein
MNILQALPTATCLFLFVAPFALKFAFQGAEAWFASLLPEG